MTASSLTLTAAMMVATWIPIFYIVRPPNWSGTFKIMDSLPDSKWNFRCMPATSRMAMWSLHIRHSALSNLTTRFIALQLVHFVGRPSACPVTKWKLFVARNFNASNNWNKGGSGCPLLLGRWRCGCSRFKMSSNVSLRKRKLVKIWTSEKCSNGFCLSTKLR